MTARHEWLPRLREVFDGRPVAWAGLRAVGDYDGRERTLDVFNADARDQLDLLTRFRGLRSEIEAALGGSIIVLFHTTTETTRLYAEVVARHVEQELEELVRRLVELLPGAHVERRRGALHEPAIVVSIQDRRVLIQCDATSGYTIHLIDTSSLSGDPDFRTTSVERAAQSVRLLVLEPEEDARFAADLKTIPERRPANDGEIVADPSDLKVEDQAVEVKGKQPPRKAA
jgi:hypothetical protein